jgi:hypothetical protein
MFDRFQDILGGGIGLVSSIFMLAETEPAIDRTAHIEKEDQPVLVHLLQESLVELADPGIGVADGVKLLDKRQVLVSDIAGYPHLSHRMHRKPHRIGFDDLLHIGTVSFLEFDMGDIFQLFSGFDRDKSITGQYQLENSHEQKRRHLNVVNDNFFRAVGEAELLQYFFEKSSGILGISTGFKQPVKLCLSIATLDNVKKRSFYQRAYSQMVKKPRESGRQVGEQHLFLYSFVRISNLFNLVIWCHIGSP